jgi:hypothetical protein
MSGEKCAVHAEKIHQLETRANKVDTLLEKIQNRLPHWATVVISLLTLAIGWLLANG